MIIDNNVVRRVLVVADDPDFKYVHDRIYKKRKRSPRMIYGGKLTEEYFTNHEVRSLMRILDQAGIARQESASLIEAEEQRIIATGLCKSNDTHIIALGNVSGTRLLVTDDGECSRDWSNHEILSNPRGKVYKNRSHQSLLDEFCR